MRIDSLVSLLCLVGASRVVRSAKDLIPGRLVPLYGDLDVSETPNILNSVLQGIDACGHRFVWRNRQELRNATAHAGPLVLVATGGPNAEEHAYFHTNADTQQIVLLHLSDEFLVQTDTAQYGPAVQQVFRHYYHKEMGEKAFAYLGETKVKHLPPVAWMPLGPARLRPLPTAYSLGLLDRTHLWSWTGSTDNKPERESMLAALDAHSRAPDIKARGVFRRFSGFAGVPGGSLGSMGAWEYTMLMHQTQFAPVPAGGSPEQFRIWEAFEAGCLPILLARHMEQDEVLYPLKALGFEVIALQEWQELPGKLLQLADDLAANPGVYTQKQRHNTKLWAHVKGALSAAIAQVVCETGSHATSITRS